MFAVVLDHFEEELGVFDLIGDGGEGKGVAGEAAGGFAGAMRCRLCLANAPRKSADGG